MHLHIHMYGLAAGSLYGLRLCLVARCGCVMRGLYPPALLGRSRRGGGCTWCCGGGVPFLLRAAGL